MKKGVSIFLLGVLLMAGVAVVSGDAAYKMAMSAHNYFFPSYKQELVTIYVPQGVTLWEIAEKYLPEQDKTRRVDEMVYFITKYNNIKGDEHILPGQKLIIPLDKELGGHDERQINHDC